MEGLTLPAACAGDRRVGKGGHTDQCQNTGAEKMAGHRRLSFHHRCAPELTMPTLKDRADEGLLTVLTPADGVGAAATKQDFGTSRRQLADKIDVRRCSIQSSVDCRKGVLCPSLYVPPPTRVPARRPMGERPAPGHKVRRASPRLQDLRSAPACINWT
jgi:hypothetical protein